MGVRDTVTQIVKGWAGMQSNPRGTDALHALWASNPLGSWSNAADDLANQINQAFGTDLQGKDFNPPGAIKTVDDLVTAVT
jgi:hypothetical protein